MEALARLHRVDDTQPLLAIRTEIRKGFATDWQVTGVLSRDFRVPTLNDLYWIPGGNPDLQTELSWSQELELSKSWNDQGNAYTKVTFYNRNVDNWIQWAQQDGNQFWSAGNVSEVWSRGLEFVSFLQISFDQSKLWLESRYQYTKSTYEEAIANPKIDKGTQLWYTPVHQVSLQVGWERRGFLLQYMQRYVGKTEGINADLADYYLGDIHLIWRKLEKEMGLRCFLEVNNLWNASYRVIERRPMPGRYLRIGIQTNFSL